MTSISTPNRQTGASSGRTATSQPLAGTAQLDNSGMRTAGEAAVRTGIATSKSVQDSGASVDDVIADPRQGVATVTFSLPMTTPLTKSRVLAAAVAIAQEGFGANTEVKFVTGRCVAVPSGAKSAQIVFVGDIARATLQALGQSPTEEQMQGAFTNAWWNPQIKQ